MTDLRIAVDARPLCHPETGIGRYTRELLSRMCRMGAQWYFYSPQPYDQSEFGAENITHRVALIPGFMGGSQASQLLFPRWAGQDSIDVFWSPRHHLPLFLGSTIRTVLTVHDLVWLKHGDLMRTSRRITEALLMPRSVKRSDKIVTGTQFIAAEMDQAFSDIESRLTVIPYASCFEGYSADLVPQRSDADYFLFVGTMEPRKNLSVLLGAYRAYVRQCQSPKKLKLVGGVGWGGVDPGRLTADFGLCGLVDVEGNVTDSKLAQLYAGAYALVMPSIYEGFGLPIVESMAYGVPAIISRNSAMSEVAGMAGYSIDPASEHSICAALLDLSLESTAYCELRNKALTRSKSFSWDRSATAMYKLLRDWV